MRNIFIYIVVAISLFTFQSEKVFAQDYIHIHKILDTESAILALGASIRLLQVSFIMRQTQTSTF